MSSQLSITTQINQSNFASRLTEAFLGSSRRRTCKHCTLPPEAVLVSPARSAGATNPSPSCNWLLGELGRTVMRAALRVSETAGGHGWPPSHWQTRRVMQSLTIAKPGHLTVLVQHHAVIATQQRELFPSPCARPSTLGYGSATVHTLERPHTLASVDHEAEHHILERSQIHLSPDCTK